MSVSNGLHHIGFSVSDIGRSIDFYRLLLQREPAQRRFFDEKYIADIVGYEGCEMDCAYFVLPGNDALLELLEYKKPRSTGVDMETYNAGNSHLCLIVDDLEAEYERLVSAGVSFRSRPVYVPTETQEEMAAGGAALYLRDPDGITVELYQLPPGGEDRAQAGWEG